MKRINIIKFLTYVLVIVAITGIVIMLMSINMKLLSVLNWYKASNSIIDKVSLFASGFAYSVSSIAIVIWYSADTKNKWKNLGTILLKLTFVIIDGFHVFIYNNEHIKDLSAWLSPLYAFQTAMILFFIGAVADKLIKETNTKVTISNVSVNAEKEKEYEGAFAMLKTKYDKLKEISESYFKGYLKWERSRIRKIKEENRTENDLLILEQANELI